MAESEEHFLPVEVLPVEVLPAEVDPAPVETEMGVAMTTTLPEMVLGVPVNTKTMVVAMMAPPVVAATKMMTNPTTTSARRTVHGKGAGVYVALIKKGHLRSCDCGHHGGHGGGDPPPRDGDPQFFGDKYKIAQLKCKPTKFPNVPTAHALR